MPKVKKSPFQLGSPTTDNPVKEMSWCFEHHIRVVVDPEAIKEPNGEWKQTSRYQVSIHQGDRIRESGYIYTKDNVLDAVHEAYRQIYKMNYGKKKEE